VTRRATGGRLVVLRGLVEAGELEPPVADPAVVVLLELGRTWEDITRLKTREAVL
jgi:hypothetical protein